MPPSTIFSYPTIWKQWSQTFYRMCHWYVILVAKLQLGNGTNTTGLATFDISNGNG